ncbi:MAG: type II toxin-antitoxin system VapC family toxin [Propionibacteriaceae bacterium]|nr:type II toxin-antitoxin system VapC family toxin [Propionibacteriaceae bacterium]
MADLLISSAALTEDLPLVTRDPNDFAGLEGLVTIIAV